MINSFNSIELKKKSQEIKKNMTNNGKIRIKKKTSSLFVGDLSTKWSEINLKKVFSEIGPLSSVKVCRHFVSGKTLGYGYINFLKNEDAKKAIEVLNFYKKPGFFNKPIRLMWQNKNKALRNSGAGNIFIKNLPLDFDSKELIKLFSNFGEILSAKVMLDGNGISKGFGFVHYVKIENSIDAIEKMNGFFIKKKKIFVGPFIPKRIRRLQGITKRIFTNLYIKNIQLKNCNELFVRDLFDIFGEITSIFVPKKNNLPLGTAFVNFKTRDEAEEAIFAMHKKTVRGKELFVGEAKNKLERQRMLKRRFLRKKMGEIKVLNLHNLIIINIPNKELDKKFLISHTNIWNNLKYCKIYNYKKNDKSLNTLYLCLTKKKDFYLKKNFQDRKFSTENESLTINFENIRLNKKKGNKKKIVKKFLYEVKIKNKLLKSKKMFIQLSLDKNTNNLKKFLINLFTRWACSVKKTEYKKFVQKIFLMKKNNIISLFFCKLFLEKKKLLNN
jgi:RNA recognition motif-containing protein